MIAAEGLLFVVFVVYGEQFVSDVKFTFVCLYGNFKKVLLVGYLFWTIVL